MSKIIVNMLKLNSNYFRLSSTIKASTFCCYRTYSSKPSAEFIIDSPFEKISIPHQSLTDFIFNDITENSALNTALTCGKSGRNYNYTMLQFSINRFAHSILSQYEISPSDTIGILLPNLPEYAILSHGALKAGLIVTFVNPLYTHDEVLRQFQNASVKIIATIPQLLDTATKIGNHLSDYKGTICVGGEDEPTRKVSSLKGILERGGRDEVKLPEINVKETAILPYSSGTTGVPKGVKLSHYNLVSNLIQTDNPFIQIHNESDDPLRVFTVLPFFHIFGFNTILNICLMTRSHLITLPNFSPDGYMKCLHDYKPHVLFVVPSLMKFLAENSEIKKDFLKSVKFVRSGAAPLSESLIERFREKFGKSIDIKQGYGMTESSPLTIAIPNNVPLSKHNSIGVLVSNTSGKIVNQTSGATLGPNKPGELLLKGPQVMLGYLNNEEATKNTIDEDGWLHTGDVAYYDSDGYIFIIDRSKELIKVKGNQVSPTELENLILKLPEVADVAVIGIPDDLYDEVPKAFVVKKPGAKLTENDISEYVSSNVVHYKKLTGGVAFLDAIPRNPSGKILRNELKIIKKAC